MVSEGGELRSPGSALWPCSPACPDCVRARRRRRACFVPRQDPWTLVRTRQNQYWQFDTSNNSYLTSYYAKRCWRSKASWGHDQLRALGRRAYGTDRDRGASRPCQICTAAATSLNTLRCRQLPTDTATADEAQQAAETGSSRSPLLISLAFSHNRHGHMVFRFAAASPPADSSSRILQPTLGCRISTRHLP
jgi:hypothetical protein